MSAGTYYSTLGLSPDCTEDEIKRSYRALARRFHPDSGHADASEAEFSKITEAYNVLSDADARKDYDFKCGFQDLKKQKLREYETTQAHADLLERLKGNIVGDRKKEPKQFGKDSAKTRREEAEEDNLRRLSRQAKKDAEEKGIWGKVTQSIRRAAGGTVEVGDDDLEEVNSGFGGSRHSVDMRGERIFHFTIDAMESLEGTSRELALDSEEGPRLIRVKIPGGIIAGQILRVNCPPKGNEDARQLQVRIEIAPHEYVEREGLDIIVKVPVTVSESINGAKFEVPSPDGPLALEIPSGWRGEKRIRYRGKGVMNPADGSRGDLYVKTFVVLPDQLSPGLMEAAKALESGYLNNVRSKLPRKLPKVEPSKS